MKLRTRLLAGVSIYQLLLAGVGLIGFLSAQASLRGMQTAVEHHVAELNALSSLTSEVHRIRTLALRHALSESIPAQADYEDDIREAEARADRMVDQLLQIQERFGDDDDIQDIHNWQAAWTAYLRVQEEQLLPLRGPGHREEVEQLTANAGPLAKPYEEATRNLATLQASLSSASTERLTQAQTEFTWNRNLLLIFTSLAGLLGVGLGLHQSSRLGRAVEAVSQAARRVAGGDLTQRVQVATGDEIESLAESFNVMTDNLQRMTAAQSAHLSELEAANLALEIEVAERRRAEEGLRESEHRFRSVTQSVKEAIVSADRAGHITFWNRGAERIFGYTEAEALGKSFCGLLAPSTADSEAELDDAVCLRRWVGQTTELVGLRRNYTPVPLELSITELAAGQDVYYTATLRDITERRAMDQLKNEFVSMVSHELRTPMNGVIGMVDLLLRTELSPRQRTYAVGLEHSGQSLLGIIDDIIDFTKIEAGKFQLESGPVDVRDLVEGAAAVVAEQAHSKGLELACLVDRDVPEALGGDARRLRQVLLNLMVNAIKFTRVGEVAVHVRLQEQTPESVLVRFEVTDTGIGIPREARQRLFQPFVQVHDASQRQYGGTGLGLAISKRLVELMGGAVGAESNQHPDSPGSTFWFTVPLTKPAGSSAEDSPGANDALAGLRILVVSDNTTTRAALEEQLAAWGARSAGAASAMEALEQLNAAAEADAPHRVVLVDMQLPRREGAALARSIKANPQLRPTHVVALTSVAPDAAPRVASELLSATIEKPVRRSRLLEALTDLVAPPRHRGRLRPVYEHPTTPAAGARILVIEDTPINQLAAAHMLEELGYRPDVVASGSAGLAALEHQRYAAVLMDCQMPEMDGFQTTAEIRRREGAGPRTPIIAMTASAMLGDRERCLTAGMDDYLSKPVRVAAMAAALERWLPPAPPAEAEADAWDGTTDEDNQPLDAQAMAGLDHLGTAGASEVLREMVSLFCAEAPERLAAVQAAQRASDAEALRVAAHTLRGTAATVGARRVRDVCEEIERRAGLGDVESAAGLVEHDLPRALEHASGALPALLQDLPGDIQGDIECAS